MSKSANIVYSYQPYVVIGLLCITTILFFKSTPIYLPGNTDLLPDYRANDRLHLTTSHHGTTIAGDHNIWRINNTLASETSWIDLDIIPAAHHNALYLSAEIKTVLNPVMNTPIRRSANLMLLAADQRLNWDYRSLHMVADINQTLDWSAFGSGFSIKPGSTRYRISANLAGHTGELWVRALRLYEAKVNPVYTAGYYSLIALWILLFSYLATPLIKNRKIITQYWPLVAVLLFISIGILIPADTKNALLIQLYQLFTLSGPDIPAQHPISGTQYPLYWLDKLGHLVAFGFAGFILAWKHRNAGWHYFLVLVWFAAITEILQYFVPDRNPLLSDLLIDIAGIVAGISLARLIGRLAARTDQAHPP